jgi:lipase maturation factor 1
MKELVDDRQPMPSANGWILYDGECGFCFRWVHLWKNVVESRGFLLKDLQSASVEAILKIPPQNLLDDIRVLTPDGNLKSGADAYLFVARRIWWTWPFYVVFSIPGFNWILRRSYKWFNRNRYRVSRYCPLPNARKE